MMIRSCHILRAGAGLLALASFAVACTWAGRAQAQTADASPLAFIQTQQVKVSTQNRSARRIARERPASRGSAGQVQAGKGSGIIPPRTPYKRGRLECANNMNRRWQASGVAGTGSARALDYLTWGRGVSGPRPGAVQVERRRGWGTGHVKLVLRFENGRWICDNPSVSWQAWVEAPCGSRAIAWRVA
jgi:hypothetical protein